MTAVSLHGPRSSSSPQSTARLLLNKVPEVTLYFWIIKIMATTVGETAADYIAFDRGLGLSNTTWFASAILLAALAAQLRSRRYIPALYWFTVVTVSIVGTLVTDNLTDVAGISLFVTTPLFALALALTFAAWYRKEGTLSIHEIVTSRREVFYWLTILLTFALGTAAGDLLAETLALGYLVSAVLFGLMIAAITASWYFFDANPVLTFWLGYILTRPLGASLGDLLSQPGSNGGLGLGTTGTSALFLLSIFALVTWLTVTRRDELAPVDAAVVAHEHSLEATGA